MPDFQHAQLDWDEDGQPLSRAFGGIYFSRHSGFNETRHVFLVTNRLAKRSATLDDGKVLCIGETGFGTGLNFLCVWQLLERVAPIGACLEFVSTEKFPLVTAGPRCTLTLWPELASWSEALLGQYLALHPGFQHLAFVGGRVGLTLLLDDALGCLLQLDVWVDAWLLDGFVPAKNPDMWSPALSTELARLPAPQAILDTFTSAGFVRRGLIEAGLAIQRAPGYRQKHEMFDDTYQGPPASAGKSRYVYPTLHAGRRAALMVDGGLADCANAVSLTMRGWQVTLIERRLGLAREVSGNPQGVFYLKLSAHSTLLSRLVLNGFGHTRRLLKRLRHGHDWDVCDVLRPALDAKETQRQAQLAVAFPTDLLHGLDCEQTERLAGVPLPAGDLSYPEAGLVHPPMPCQALAATPGTTPLSDRTVRLCREGDDWCAYAGDERLAHAPLAVLATAANIRDLSSAAELSLKRIRGQVTRLPATLQNRALRAVVYVEGYVAPPRGDKRTLDASLDSKNGDLVSTLIEHQSSPELLRGILPDLLQRLGADGLPLERLEGRAILRRTSPDYLPLVGLLAEHTAFDEAYAMLARDARQVSKRTCPQLPGPHLSNGHGSRGLINALLSGELLVA